MKNKDLQTKTTSLQRGKGITTIYVGNLSYRKREGEVKKMFQKFGKVLYVKNVVDPKNGHNRGFSFVQMPSKENALNAIDHLNGKLVDDRTLKVSIANEREGSRVLGNKSFKKYTKEKLKEDIKNKVEKRKQLKGLDLLFAHKNKPKK